MTDLDAILQHASPDVRELNAELVNGKPGPGRRPVKVQEFEARPMASERQEQAALFEWAALMAPQVPELDMLMAIPNGQYRAGQRPEPGIKAGAPDCVLPVPRGRYCGLWIELKIPGNTTTPEQDWWLAALEKLGHRVAVCYGFSDARCVVESYLGIGNG